MGEIEFHGVDIFKGTSAQAYIDYSQKPQPTWEYLEEPMWKIILGNNIDLSRANILDVGSGAGKLYKLLLEYGANPGTTLLIEPNIELSSYLHSALNAPCISGKGSDIGHHLLQHGEIDLITSSMVANHMTNREYEHFIKYSSGALSPNGLLVYTVPFPEGKALKHNFDVNDNKKVVTEDAKWGGTVKYHHRSEERQLMVLQKYGFKVKRILYGYENFISKHIIESGERVLKKSLRGHKRTMFWAEKNVN